MANLHPSIAHLAFLVGTWRGEGKGVYPTIADFTYLEEITFSHVGKPFLAYGQKTKRSGDHPEQGLPLHTEAGYLRSAGNGAMELTIAQPTGITEVHTGTIEGTTIRLSSMSVGLTPTAKRVLSVERNLEVTDSTLRYELFMSAVGQEHQIHLIATLERVAPGLHTPEA